MKAGLAIAVIPGDGIGPEVTEQAMRVVESVLRAGGHSVEFDELDINADRYLRTGVALDAADLDRLGRADAIFLGALGDPRVAPGVLEQGVIVAMRRHFRQSVNLRPIRLLPGVSSPLRELETEACNFVIVRENTEGLYAGGSSSAQMNSPHAVAIQTSITTYVATKAVITYAFELAASRSNRLTVCHKTNILVDAGRIWSEVTAEVARDFPDVHVSYAHADAMTLHMVQRPGSFDVIVTDNLFGDVLSDLGAAIAGGLGTAASGNLNLDGSAPSMFEPVHGSAPDIAGTGRANPAAAILSAGLMLEHLGLSEAAELCRRAASDALLDFAAVGREMNTVQFGDLSLDAVAREQLSAG